MHGKYTDAQLFTRQVTKKMKTLDPYGSFLTKGSEITPELIEYMKEAFAEKGPELRPPDIPVPNHEVSEVKEESKIKEASEVEEVSESKEDPEVEEVSESKEDPEVEEVSESKGEDDDKETSELDKLLGETTPTPSQDPVIIDLDPEPSIHTSKIRKGSLKKTCGNCSRKYKKSSKCENCKNGYCKNHCFVSCRQCKLKKLCVNCHSSNVSYSCKSCKRATKKFLDDEAKVSDDEKDSKDKGENVWDEDTDDDQYLEEIKKKAGSLDGFVVSDDEFPEVDFSDLHTKRRFDFEFDLVHNQKGEKKRKTGKNTSQTSHPKSTSNAFTTEVICDFITEPQTNWKNYQRFLESVDRSVKETGNDFDVNEFQITLQYTLVILLKICIPDNRNDLCKYIEDNQLDRNTFKNIINKVMSNYLDFIDSIAGQKKIGCLIQLLGYIDKYSEYSRKETKIRETGKYYCAVTGNVLKKGENVYVLELRTMYDRELPKVYFYISRYHDKNLPEYYLGIFDVILINRWYINRIGYRLKHLIDKKNKFPVSMSGQEKIRIILSQTHLKNLAPTLTEQLCFRSLLKTLSNFDNMIS